MNANIMRIVTGAYLIASFIVMPIYADTDYADSRANMLRLIEYNVRETGRYIGKMEFDRRIMRVMGNVPRHLFVPEMYRENAYENRPLPIGFGQTISQPYIVALMTDLLSVKATDKVLEVGTGSGYQAAILSGLVARVFTIEIIEELSRRADLVIKQQGYSNIQTRIGDGYYGWPEQAPFDAIVVTAAAGHIPPPLIQQLKPGGRMVIPVGSRFMVQQLVMVTKDERGKISARQILPVRFVPLTGKHD